MDITGRPCGLMIANIVTDQGGDREHEVAACPTAPTADR